MLTDPGIGSMLLCVWAAKNALVILGGTRATWLYNKKFYYNGQESFYSKQQLFFSSTIEFHVAARIFTEV